MIPVQRVLHAVVASLLLLEGRATAQVTFNMTLFSELNVEEVIVGPDVAMTVAAVVVRSDTNQVVTGQLMDVSLENVQGNWELSGAQIQANGCGQGHVWVICHGTGSANLHVRWYPNAGMPAPPLAERVIPLSSVNDNSNDCSADPGWLPKLTPAQNIRVWASTVFQSSVSYSRTVWSGTGFVGFVDSTLDQAQVTVNDEISALPRFATTTPFRQILLNRRTMDPCMTDPVLELRQRYPGRVARHHIDMCVAHEFGHALGLDHHPTQRPALMFNNAQDVYFINGTSAPQCNEIGGLAGLGY